MATGQDDDIDWLAGPSVDEAYDPTYVHVTPESISVLCVSDCLEQLERSAAIPNRLALAAKSAHLALQSALTAALAGTANIGAHPPKIREQYLSYLNNRDESTTARPTVDRVMSFVELLETATSTALEWRQRPLEISDDQKRLVDRLTKIRHDVEHPKQMLHSIEPAYIKATLPVAIALTIELLADVFHHLEEGDLDRLREFATRISDLCEVEAD